MALRARILWTLLIAAMGGAVGLAAWKSDSPPSPPAKVWGAATGRPDARPLPEFLLRDQSGRPFGSPDVKGRVWIADFIFTSCAGQCPQMTARMWTLQERLPQEVLLVSVSVDPARDTPEVLTRYAAGHGADPGRWRFLTGEPAAIERLCREGFLLSMSEEGTPQEPITHSARFVLVDRTGVIRGSYDSSDAQAVDRLVKEAGGLL